jgi:hypothetical protein
MVACDFLSTLVFLYCHLSDIQCVYCYFVYRHVVYIDVVYIDIVYIDVAYIDVVYIDVVYIHFVCRQTKIKLALIV